MDSKLKSTFNFYNDANKAAFSKSILDMPSASLKPLNRMYYSKMQTMDNHELFLKHMFFHCDAYDDNSKAAFKYFMKKYEAVMLSDLDKMLITPAAYVQGGNSEYNLFNDGNVDLLLNKLIDSLKKNGSNINLNEFMSVKSLFGMINVTYVDDTTGQFLPNGVNLDICYVS